MNADVKRKWVEALRSGEYQQTKGVLGRVANDDTPATYCCLGVLCDLARKEGAVGAPVVRADGSLAFPNGLSADEGGVPPTAVVIWAELPEPNPDVRLDGRTDSLAGLNDSGKTFDEIADLIEEQM